MLFTLGLKELPFEQKEDQIIYIENEYDKKVNRYIQKNYDAIRKHFHSRGFSFIYIPKRLEEIRRAEVVAFNAPYAKPKDEVTIGSDFLLEYMVHPENRNNIPPSLIYYNPYKRDSDYKEAIIQYRGIELTPESGYTKTSDLFNILNEIKNDLIQPLIALIDSQETYSEQPHISIENKAIEAFKRFGKNSITEDDEDSSKNSTIVVRRMIRREVDDYDEEIQKKLDELRALVTELRMQGVDDYIFQKTIYGEEKLSRLLISKDYRILLPDYKNTEIELRPLPKTLYLLFLRHPEGIYQKGLCDYREELMQIYRAIKGGFYNETEARKSINLMTTPTNNSANEKIASVKAAIGMKFKDTIASNYYISGVKNEKKKIILPQELITWEKPI